MTKLKANLIRLFFVLTVTLSSACMTEIPSEESSAKKDETNKIENNPISKLSGCRKLGFEPRIFKKNYPLEWFAMKLKGRVLYPNGTPARNVSGVLSVNASGTLAGDFKYIFDYVKDPEISYYSALSHVLVPFSSDSLGRVIIKLPFASWTWKLTDFSNNIVSTNKIGEFGSVYFFDFDSLHFRVEVTGGSIACGDLCKTSNEASQSMDQKCSSACEVWQKDEKSILVSEEFEYFSGDGNCPQPVEPFAYGSVEYSFSLL